VTLALTAASTFFSSTELTAGLINGDGTFRAGVAATEEELSSLAEFFGFFDPTINHPMGPSGIEIIAPYRPCPFRDPMKYPTAENVNIKKKHK